MHPGDENRVTSSLDLTPPYNATGVTYQTIAAQCCLPAGDGESNGINTPQDVCRRRPTPSGGNSGLNDDCIAGYGGEGDITPFTYTETKYFCDSLGLDLCQQACTGQGCNYDAFPVWTGAPCPGPPPPSPPPLAPITMREGGVAVVSGFGYDPETHAGFLCAFEITSLRDYTSEITPPRLYLRGPRLTS